MAADEPKSALDQAGVGALGVTHSEDGVDLTLIRWMLSLTPAERLKVLQQNVRSILRLRGEDTES